jgi:alcohol dehydrogenase
MNFSLEFPVKLISGIDCIKKNKEILDLGSCALIVTGRSGARLSGALDDVCDTLNELGITYHIFDSIAENPPLETCFEGGRLASDVDADFVVGIGGGSAIDAAKAIAAFATNQQITMDEIFSTQRRINRALPIVAIPTTSGTGSEANSYSILSLPDGIRKKTFSASDSWPTISFLDPRYTYSLSNEQTMSTALDAFAHALESYMSPKSTEISAMLALYAANIIWHTVKDAPAEYTPQMHEKLLCASCAAGIAISVTGTGFPHPLGYSLTMLDGIPHGRACAVFDGDYIRYNLRTAAGSERLKKFAAHIGEDIETIADRLPILADVKITLSEREISEHVDLICDAKNYHNSPYVISKEEMIEIYRSHFA